MKKTKDFNDWIEASLPFRAPVKITDEFHYYLFLWLFDIILLVPFLIMAIFLWIWKARKKSSFPKRMFFGSHPIVTHMQNIQVLEEKYTCTLFAFEDWSEGSMHDGITIHDIMPHFLARKNPYTFGSYWMMLWILYRFDVVHLYFDSGLLERTLWWRIEPWLYQIFNIKTVLYPYGSDVMQVSKNNNRLQRFGHMRFKKNYFIMDKKREDRNRWWCKYADLVIGYAPYIDFLPRIDVLTWHGHIVNDIKTVPFPPIEDKIKIVHFASHGIRKSSTFICETLTKLAQNFSNIEVECLSGLPRELAMQKLNKAHIFVDSLNDGYLQFSSLEAMLKGRVVLSYIDNSLKQFFINLSPRRYNAFFKQFPLIEIEHETLYDKLEELVKNPDSLTEISKQNAAFSRNMVSENIEAYQKIIATLVAE